MRLSDKLLERIKRELPQLRLGHGWEIRRLRRGRHGKSAGAWAWCLVNPNGGTSIGSEDTMQDCLKAHHLTVYESGFSKLINAEFIKK